ncbi:MAG TPA: D-tyrosyl-tRNA(Tyr) deacylase [Gammaproteobacteria bacterium]|nr:D-tyrosyl-tRNA(Tyr) deacylase [Gammaproteobacteria bacterium]
MKVVLQRVLGARVTVAGRAIGKIEQGLLIYLGVSATDEPEDVSWLVEKIANLRMFDEAGDGETKTTLSIKEIGGSALVISQFTLLADARRGRRPSFSAAAAPAQANELYQRFVQELGGHLPVQTGEFGADMQVSSVNEGPFTLVLEHPNPGGPA